MLRPGDIVMTAAGTIGKSLLYHSEDAACYAGYLVRFRPRSDVDERFGIHSGLHKTFEQLG